jgi:protein SCO1/2
MNARRLLFIILAVAAGPLRAAVDAPPVQVPSSALTAAALKGLGYEQKLGATIPAGLVFTDSTGARVPLDSLLARKPTLLALVYYNCPNLCTLVLNGMVSSLNDLRRDVGDGFQVVVVSIDPTETPALAAEKKATYVRRYSRGQTADWTFLVGDDASIHRLADAVGYRYAFDPAIHQYAHGSGLVLIDADRRVSQYFLGIEYRPTDLELAIQRAQGGGIGSAVPSFLLLCYCYNPLTGPYGFLIFSILKAAALLTVVALGVFIVTQVRREHAGKAAP